MKINDIKKYLLYALLFVTISLLTYANSLQNEFLIDDHGFMIGQFRQEIPDFISFFTSTFSKHYTPIADLLKVALFSVMGAEPLPYHLFNIILFALTCTALFFIYNVYQSREIQVS